MASHRWNRGSVLDIPNPAINWYTNSPNWPFNPLIVTGEPEPTTGLIIPGRGSQDAIPDCLAQLINSCGVFDINITLSAGATSISLITTAELGTRPAVYTGGAGSNYVKTDTVETLRDRYEIKERTYPIGHPDAGDPIPGGPRPADAYTTRQVEESADGSGGEIIVEIGWWSRSQADSATAGYIPATYYPEHDVWGIDGKIIGISGYIFEPGQSYTLWNTGLNGLDGDNEISEGIEVFGVPVKSLHSTGLTATGSITSSAPLDL
jgi:hypothetical protein